MHARLADIDAHSAEARAARILAGLGFDADAQARPCSDFSGGWRMRVALAGVLFSEPDLLLLDEPTNYLDLEGTLWLERYLARYPRTVIVISHDRDLLNTAVNSIIHLIDRKLTFWRGGYNSFERQYRERQALQGKLRVKQEAERKHMQAFVDRFRAKASEGAPGAVASEGDRQAAADRRDHAGKRCAVPLPRPRPAAIAADRAHGGRVGRLRARRTGSDRLESPHRRR